jgi:hypothetical protein
MSMHDKYIEELEFCIKLWEKQGYCGFGGHTKCEQCAAPYILWKLSTGEILHGKMTRLTLEDWKKRVETKI